MSCKIAQQSVTVAGKDAELFLIDAVNLADQDVEVRGIDDFFCRLGQQRKSPSGMALLKCRGHLPMATTVALVGYLMKCFSIVLCHDKKLTGYVVSVSNNLNYPTGTLILETKVRSC